ncbi:MAG: hypothetical protein RLZZ262_753, partial [Bacteroidota bacterium]
FRYLVKKITDSPKLLEALQKVCGTLQVNCKLPELDCETRWNSTWLMLSSVIQIQKPLDELLRSIENAHEGFTGLSISPKDDLAKGFQKESWSAVQDFCSFLKPFKEATVLMSASEYPTLGMVVPVFHIVSEQVRLAIAASTGFRSTHTIRFAMAVQSKLDEYREIVNCKQVKIAAFLDPRVKQYLSKVGIDMDELKKDIIQDFTTEYELTFLKQQSQETAISSAPDNGGESFLQLLTGQMKSPLIVN